MSSSQHPSISKAEIEVMKVIWKQEPISVRDAFEAINKQRKDPLTRTTVLKHIQRLEIKGWLTRDDGRPARYTSTVSSQAATQSLMSSFREMLFDGSTLSMVRCLVHDGQLSKDEIEELQKLIDASSSHS